jgi:hypothetical protein
LQTLPYTGDIQEDPMVEIWKIQLFLVEFFPKNIFRQVATPLFFLVTK